MAEKLLASRASGRPFVSGSGVAPRTVQEAYSAQDMVLAALEPGRRPVAWKVSPPKGGAEPFASPIPSASIYASGAVVPSAGLRLFGIECEIAFRLGRDLVAREGVPDASDILDAVAEAVVAIELCESRLADWQDASPLWRLADFQLNGALVVGSGCAAWRARDWRAQPVELCIDGERVAGAYGSHPCGDPSVLLRALAAHCAKRSAGLRRGDLVTTGSWTGMTIARPGVRLRAVFPGVGEAELRIAP